MPNKVLTGLSSKAQLPQHVLRLVQVQFSFLILMIQNITIITITATIF